MAILKGGSTIGGSRIISLNDTATTNTAGKIVMRDVNGDFSAGTITAALSGNAATATKLGTSTIGSTTLPIYLNAGVPTALTQANLRIGVFGSSAIGSASQPVYIAANGVATAGNSIPSVSSTPTDGATTTAISSDWAFDNVKTSVPSGAVFTDTWNANSLNVAGYVAAPTSSNANKVWKTDASGNPAWEAITQNATHTGEVIGATTLTISNDAVTNAKLANMNAGTIKGRDNGTDGDPQDLTISQVQGLIGLETTLTASSDVKIPSSKAVATYVTGLGYVTSSGVTSISAGNGMNFTTITGTGSVTMGTPSTLTSTSTDSVTATSHTHAITNYAINGTTNQITVTGAGKVLGATTTLSLPQNIHTGATPTFARLSLSQPMTAGTTAAFTNPHLALVPTNNVDNTGFVGMTFATSSTSANYGFSFGALRSTDGSGSIIIRNHASDAAGTEIFRLDAAGNLTIPGKMIVSETEVSSTSNGILFEGSAADDFEGLLKAGTLTADRTYTLPDASGTVALTSNIGNGTLTVQGDTGLSGSGTFTANQSGNTTITLTNSDKGSSQNIFKNFTDGTTTSSADSNNDTFKFRGSGVTVAVQNDDATHGDNLLISWAHPDTSSQTSVDNSNGTVIQDITLDGAGHVTAIGSFNLDDRYAAASSLSNYLPLSGGSIVATSANYCPLSVSILALDDENNIQEWFRSGVAAPYVYINNSGQIVSNLSTAAPFIVSSTTKVANLNVDYLDGQEGSYYQNASNINAGTLAVARGGTNITSYTVGDMLYASGTTTLSKLPKGTAGQVLTMNAGATAPSWTTMSIGSTSGLMVKTTTSGVLTTLAAGTTSQYLRGDGTWQTPASGGQTYSVYLQDVHTSADGDIHLFSIGSTTKIIEFIWHNGGTNIQESVVVSMPWIGALSIFPIGGGGAIAEDLGGGDFYLQDAAVFTYCTIIEHRWS